MCSGVKRNSETLNYFLMFSTISKSSSAQSACFDFVCRVDLGERINLMNEKYKVCTRYKTPRSLTQKNANDWQIQIHICCSHQKRKPNATSYTYITWRLQKRATDQWRQPCSSGASGSELALTQPGIRQPWMSYTTVFKWWAHG